MKCRLMEKTSRTTVRQRQSITEHSKSRTTASLDMERIYSCWSIRDSERSTVLLWFIHRAENLNAPNLSGWEPMLHGSYRKAFSTSMIWILKGMQKHYNCSIILLTLFTQSILSMKTRRPKVVNPSQSRKTPLWWLKLPQLFDQSNSFVQSE